MTNRMIRGLLLLLAITLGTWASATRLVAQEGESNPAAQEKEARGAPKTTKVIELKHIHPSQVEELMGSAGVKVRRTRTRALPVVTIEGDPDAVLAAEHTIRELDIPRMGTSAEGSENIELVIHLLGANGPEVPPNTVAAGQLEAVVKELQDKFPYRSYRLFETAALRLEGRTRSMVSGLLPGFAPETPNPATYNFGVRLTDVSVRKGERWIKLGELGLNLRIPIVTGTGDNPSFHYQDIQIQTEITVREGSTVVVGKTGVQGSIRSLFLIVTANVVE